MIKTVNAHIYEKLNVLGLIELRKSIKIKNSPFMDLHVDIISHNIIALAHNYVHNGDLIADPDMTIRINYLGKTAEAMTFQNAFIYTAVYDDQQHASLKTKNELDNFLNKWLGNLLDQGFQFRFKIPRL